MTGPDSPAYTAPAADRTLDILELLSDATAPMSQTQIAEGLELTAAQVFRVLGVLERRGYISRGTEGGRYALTTRLLEVANRQEPIATLRRVAMEPMWKLARDIDQSCNLGHRVGDHLIIVAEAESPSPFGFRVRVGASFPLMGTTSGEVLLAHRPDHASEASDPSLASRLEAIRTAGFAERPDALHPGVTDIAFPILDSTGTAAAVLTVPYVATSFSTADASEVRRAVGDTAAVISSLYSGADRQ